MADDMFISNCLCGACKMSVNCASSKASNSLQYYYKCPSEKNHRRSFLWCYEYHASHKPEEVPKFLARQTWSSNSAADTSSQTDCHSPIDEQSEPDTHQKAKPIQPPLTEELPSVNKEFLGMPSIIFWVLTCIASFFMCFILVILGVILLI